MFITTKNVNIQVRPHILITNVIIYIASAAGVYVMHVISTVITYTRWTVVNIINPAKYIKLHLTSSGFNMS